MPHAPLRSLTLLPLPRTAHRLVAASLLALALVFVLPAVLAGSARAQLNVDITQGFVDPMPVAVSDFSPARPELSQTGIDIANVISGNLSRSGLFRTIEKAAFLQTADELEAGPRYGDWRVIGADALV